MPRPVFPVVKLPYDRPLSVVRILDTVKKELRKKSFGPSLPPLSSGVHKRRPSNTVTTKKTTNTSNMTARIAREPERLAKEPAASSYVDERTALDQVTVGVRDCTLTPKARPEIRITPGPQCSNSFFDRLPSSAGPFLRVPPVNITAEISRPPLA